LIVPFPLSRQAGYVDKIARHIRSLPTQDARNKYMVSIIEIEFERELDLGIDQLIVESDLIRFADDVWQTVHGERCGGAA
jgi:hypothetical protein